MPDLSGRQIRHLSWQGKKASNPRPTVLETAALLAEDQLPVVALLVRVPVERAAASEVRDFYGFVLKICESDKIAVALSRLVDGV